MNYHLPIILGSALNALFLMGPRWVGDLLFTISFLISMALAYRRGWKGAPFLYLLGMASGFLFEYLGVNYGFPFGSYEYLAFERAKVLGVPVPIVMAWGAYIYTSCKPP